jgi:hypothetical protein
MRDIITSEVVFSVFGGVCVVLLWHIAKLLEAIRDTLADISRTRGRAIDLGDDL